MTLSPRVFRYSLFAVFLLLAFVVIVGGIIFYHAIPNYNGQATLKGLSSNVHVIRDNHGVPHIFADTMKDGVRALGYVHASERMFQMEMNRRAGQGRLSEVIGSDTLGIDKFTRTLGLYALAETSFQSLSPETRDYFEAYAEGVNAWLETHRHSMPEEFLILGIKPEPWRPADSVVWGKLMALQLSQNYKLELLRHSLQSKISPTMMTRLFPVLPTTSPVTVGPQTTNFSQPLDLTTDKKTKTPKQHPKPKNTHSGAYEREQPESSVLEFAEAPGTKNVSAIQTLGEFTGLNHAASNEWVISGKRTKSGKPILANDPHLGLEAPILWYLARIVTPDFWIKGATVPGLPIVLLGQNDHIAWGFTTTNSDTEDLFIETIDPRNSTHYLTPSGSEPFLIHDETIVVKGSRDVKISVRATRHGPVLSDIDQTMETAAGPGKVMALSFTGLDSKDRSSEALFRVNHARNWKEFLEAFKIYEAPTQNVVYADREGHIGFINPGLVPVRKKGDGTVPVDGSKGLYDWRGMVPFTYLPSLFDPNAGFIFYANNVVTNGGYSTYFFSADWDEPYRAQRLQQIFDKIETHTLEISGHMQADHVSLAALQLLPYLLKQNSQNEREQKALAMLKNWDGVMDRERPEPLIFEAWLSALHEKILVEKSGLSLDEKGPYAASVLAEILNADDKNWCGNEGCNKVVLLSLDDALTYLRHRYGSDLTEYRWGKAHITLMQHKVFSHVPFLSYLSTIKLKSSGSYYTLDRGESADPDPKEPFVRRHAGGYRGLYDLADPEASRFMIATGESGHILSPHYDDLAKAWNEGQSIVLTGSYAALKAQNFADLELQPSANMSQKHE